MCPCGTCAHTYMYFTQLHSSVPGTRIIDYGQKRENKMMISKDFKFRFYTLKYYMFVVHR